MKARRLFAALPLLPLVVGALLVGGCAEERAPINRVQPQALDKTLFVGKDLLDPADDPEYWSQATVVDVGYGAAQDGLFTSTYAQPTARIKWQITEGLLIGRLAYERIEGSDGKGAGKATRDGVIACAYRIASHFDVKRAYNSTTGEELNVVEENTSDRPWFARANMRVDWSKNLNVDSYDFDTLSMMGVYGGIKYESIAYEVVDPLDENAPYFSKDNQYFDVTSKAFAKPGMVDLTHLGWGITEFPACYLGADFSGGGAPSASCNPVELTLRHSFRRVVDTDFQPKEWDGFRFSAFGGFFNERSGYDRNYGMTDSKWFRMLEHYNIWQQSHVYLKDDPAHPGQKLSVGPTEGAPIKCFVPAAECIDAACVSKCADKADKTCTDKCSTCAGTPYGADPHRDLDNDGTEDECATAGKGSTCDSFRQRCTLPYQKRVERPVVWYYSDGGQPEFFAPTEDATHEWDVAMRGAVQTARLAECARSVPSAATASCKPQFQDPTGADKTALAECVAQQSETQLKTCSDTYPMYNGQMDDNQDAVALAMEVDDCRHGIARADLKGNPAACNALADSIGAARNYASGVIALAKMPEMVILCHSPVEAGDPDLCAPKGERLPVGVSAGDCFNAKKDGNRKLIDQCNAALHARRGDLRYHHINAIAEPQVPSPWGIMVDSHDPITGETISASINLWTYVNDLWSQGVVDMSRYVAGELKTEDITEGTYIKDWSEAARAAGGTGVLPLLTEKQVEERQGDTGKRMNAKQAAEFEAQHPKAAAAAQALSVKLANVTASAGVASANSPAYLARRQAAAGTAFEAGLLTPAVQQLMGTMGMPLTNGLLDLVSPLRGGNPAMKRDLRRMRDNAMALRGACVMEAADAPLAIAGLANVLQEKFGKFDPAASKDDQYGRSARMQRFLAQRVHYAVVIHEMGHSVGLRHNFISSADPLGYRPQYWQLRTRDGTVSKACTTLAKDGATCVGPRYFDPVTPEESKNLIWMWMHSSVMDYAGEASQDLLGLGVYDFAATRMFYGDTVAVYGDKSYNGGTKRSKGLLPKVDGFGGILGQQYKIGDTDIHYSQLQKEYEVIKAASCTEVDTSLFKPARWNEERDGAFHPMLDAGIVNVNGKYTRCRQQPVDYAQWTSLRMPNTKENVAGFRGAAVYDSANRLRVPYGFATDGWADLGNASVYRHDNGGDQYEIFNFMMTQPEVNHIFDNYRRGRHSFSVKSAAERSLGRYSEKLRDGAKGLSLFRNIYRDVALEIGMSPDDLWAYAAQKFFPQSILASGMVFDHFSRQLARPEAGEHFLDEEGVLRSVESKMSSNAKPVAMIVPNGATGFMGNVAFGGRPVENRLADNKGEYDSQYTINAGSYYDKLYTSMLMTESVDNFISSSLGDFTDARYRSVSLADLFPEGYRRFLGNNLTGDEYLKGARVMTDDAGNPAVDKQMYPQWAMGWTSWYGDTPMSCFPGDGSTLCRTYAAENPGSFGGKVAPNVAAVDPQVGWEQQKFLIAWTMLYLPENQQVQWLDMLRVYELGSDPDPAIKQRIEFHNPTGKTYVARTYGKEAIFGKTVEKGVAARVLEYANSLLVVAYETTPGPDSDSDGTPDWYLPVYDAKTGLAKVKFDPAMGDGAGGTPIGCDAKDNSKCTCGNNRACVKLQHYAQVPAYMRQAVFAYGLEAPHAKGTY